MKRDMQLIRLLLLRAEGDAEAKSECEKYPVEVRAYHTQLLVDANLVDAQIQTDVEGQPIGAVTKRLTWAGHEFIDATRDNKLWKRVTARILSAGTSWTFEILGQIAKQEIKREVGLLPSE